MKIPPSFTRDDVKTGRTHHFSLEGDTVLICNHPIGDGPQDIYIELRVRKQDFLDAAKRFAEAGE